MVIRENDSKCVDLKCLKCDKLAHTEQKILKPIV